MKKTFKHKKFTAVFSDESGYFSFTGSIDGSMGACGDAIVAAYRDLELLNMVHLADCKTGTPMHAWANAEHHLKAGKPDHAWQSLGMIPAELFGKWTAAMADIMACKTTATRSCSLTDKLQERAAAALESVKQEIAEFWQERVAEVYELVEETESNLTGGFVDPEEDELEDFEEPEKVIAIARHCDVPVEDVTEEGDGRFSAAGGDYLVFTDDEADGAWDDELDNYLDECIMPELSGNLANYFDRDAWKRDARMDGRGHALSRYDGCEYDETVNGETYYIFRQ